MQSILLLANVKKFSLSSISTAELEQLLQSLWIIFATFTALRLQITKQFEMHFRIYKNNKKNKYIFLQSLFWRSSWRRSLKPDASDGARLRHPAEVQNHSVVRLDHGGQLQPEDEEVDANTNDCQAAARRRPALSSFVGVQTRPRPRSKRNFDNVEPREVQRTVSLHSQPIVSLNHQLKN
jgi:hypothetical protein